MAILKYKDPTTGDWIELSNAVGDTLPIGAIVEYDGTTVPTNWEKVNDYSTEEVKTGETWIDGKPIYKKTIQFTTSATGKHSIKHNISNLDTIIEGKGSSKSSTGTFYIFPMSSAVDNVSAYSISIQDISTTYIYFFRGTNVTGTVISYITLYYTKTTD